MKKTRELFNDIRELQAKLEDKKEKKARINRLINRKNF